MNKTIHLQRYWRKINVMHGVYTTCCVWGVYYHFLNTLLWKKLFRWQIKLFESLFYINIRQFLLYKTKISRRMVLRVLIHSSVYMYTQYSYISWLLFDGHAFRSSCILTNYFKHKHWMQHMHKQLKFKDIQFTCHMKKTLRPVVIHL